jgi:hypothetical protein
MARLVIGDSNTVMENKGDESPKIVTEEKLRCYEKFKNLQIIVEGPEQSQDFSYFLYDQFA